MKVLPLEVYPTFDPRAGLFSDRYPKKQCDLSTYGAYGSFT
jgi:hypothetical protein